VIPEGTQLVGEIAQVSNSGLLQMSLVSVIENGREIPLPSGAILVLGEGGRPLRAQVETPDRLGNDLAAFALAGIAQAAEVANDSNEAFSFDSEAGSFSSTSNNEADYLSGAIQGASEELLSQMEQRNQQALERARGQEPLFILQPGTPVQLFVNESLSISATR
jgi:type IV secretory pathway VirB10-like protein